MNPLEQQFNMLGDFAQALDKVLHPEEEEDIKFAEDCERDKINWFERTRGIK